MLKDWNDTTSSHYLVLKCKYDEITSQQLKESKGLNNLAHDLIKCDARTLLFATTN
jgi:hypothetical protein